MYVLIFFSDLNPNYKVLLYFYLIITVTYNFPCTRGLFDVGSIMAGVLFCKICHYIVKLLLIIGTLIRCKLRKHSYQGCIDQQIMIM